MRRKKYILAIAGSSRKGGNTDMLLDEFLRGAKGAGVKTEKVALRDLNIKHCTSCSKCFKTGRCVIKDDMRALYPKLVKADILVVTSPVAFSGIFSRPKTMIDRCQALWARRHILGKDLRGGRRNMIGVFISTGGSNSKMTFRGSIDTMTTFFNTLQRARKYRLLFGSIDKKGDIKRLKGALMSAYKLGKRITG
ncbi:MAG: flavodoxin family protein [Candidatus Omnitrophica bacterium]|nr:flavodoxin family protein [Candidatus Omnitrophota bacterium]